MAANILIVDDDPDTLEAARRILIYGGHDVTVVPSGREALAALDAGSFDLLLSDVDMPEMNGLDLLSQVRRSLPHQAVVMMSGTGSIDIALEAVRRGAVDFVQKPLDIDRLQLSVINALKFVQLEAVNEHLLAERDSCGDLVGQSEPMQRLRSIIQRVAPSDSRVLIQGENGTGKELIANAIHRASARRGQALVKVNCGALPASLVESELFGHEKGSFTGASQLRRGRFELADKGTLFLDEIGDLPLEAQVKLLRCLQEGEFERVGGTRTLRVDVRLIAATNRDLGEMVEAGTFREDLYYRLNVVSVWAPPLRDRRSDVRILTDTFLARMPSSERFRLTEEAMAALERLPFPGNVRELENIIERLSIFHRGAVVTPQDLDDIIHPFKGGRPQRKGPETAPTIFKQGVGYRERVLELERLLLEQALAQHDQNKVAAAEALGTDKSFFYKKCRQFGIE